MLNDTDSRRPSAATIAMPEQAVLNKEKAPSVHSPLASPRPSTLVGVAVEEDLAKYNLPVRTWRRRITPFADILAEEYEGKGTDEEPYLISWLSDDFENPQTLHDAYKWVLTMFVSVSTLAVALASSSISGAAANLQEYFGASRILVTLTISLFVLGFALGPLIFAPLSELFGRRAVFLFSYFFFTLFNGLAIASPNIGALIAFRFLAGSFGSSPLTNAGGVLADCFGPEQRGLAMALFASAPFLGPALGPLIGGALGDAYGWKAVMILLTVFSGALTIIGALIMPETYAPTLLRHRAQLLSKVTGKHYIAAMDKGKDTSAAHQFKVALSRPWVMLVMEPIVLCLSLFIALVYGLLYMDFAAYPIIFEQGRGWTATEGGLAFFGILVGMFSSLGYVLAYGNARYIRIARSFDGAIPPPEIRLFEAMLGAPLLVIGLAWFAAGNGPEVHYMVPIASGVPFGAGMVLVFLSIQSYLLDAYVVYAASVLAANSLIRSLFGAAFPLFAPYMYQNLGLHWGAAIPAFLALVCVPMPFLFYKYGPAIRQKCKYAFEAARILELMSQQRKAALARKEASQQASQQASMVANPDAAKRA